MEDTLDGFVRAIHYPECSHDRARFLRAEAGACDAECSVSPLARQSFIYILYIWRERRA